MTHEHAIAPKGFDRAFAIGIALNTVYVLVEAGAGLWGGSLSLLADAAHHLTDVLGLMIAWAAAFLSRFQPTPRQTYGFRSSSVLGAMANGLLLLVAVGDIDSDRRGRPARTP